MTPLTRAELARRAALRRPPDKSSYDRVVERYACTRKAAYMTKGSAQTAADTASRKLESEPMTAYKCRYCSCWHFGKDRTK